MEWPLKPRRQLSEPDSLARTSLPLRRPRHSPDSTEACPQLGLRCSSQSPAPTASTPSTIIAAGRDPSPCRLVEGCGHVAGCGRAAGCGREAGSCHVAAGSRPVRRLCLCGRHRPTHRPHGDPSGRATGCGCVGRRRGHWSRRPRLAPRAVCASAPPSCRALRGLGYIMLGYEGGVVARARGT